MTVTINGITVKAVLHRLIIEPITVETVSTGGIIMGDAERENKAIGLGKVVAIGPTAFVGVAGCDPSKYPTNDPRYKMEPHQIAGFNVGDVVSYNRFAGYHPDVPEFKHYKVVPDIEIGAQFEGVIKVSKSDF